MPRVAHTSLVRRSELPSQIGDLCTWINQGRLSVQLLGKPGSELSLLAYARNFEIANCGASGLVELAAPDVKPIF